MSGASWLSESSINGKSPFVQLADMGYTVYLGTNRGGFESQGHSSLSAADEAYWNFGLDGLAEDVVANMEAVSADNQGKKGTYFGYSLGSTQMMIAMSKFEQDLAQYVEKVNFLGPCMTLGPNMLKPTADLLAPGALKAEFKKAGVSAYFGPNWDFDAICENSSQETCLLAGIISDGNLSPYAWQQPLGATIDEHIEQIVTANRFQHLSLDWESAQQTAEYDLEGISTIPVSMIASLDDTVCPMEQTDALAARLSTLSKYTKIAG